jgi:hypothetical protein
MKACNAQFLYLCSFGIRVSQGRGYEGYERKCRQLGCQRLTKVQLQVRLERQMEGRRGEGNVRNLAAVNRLSSVSVRPSTFGKQYALKDYAGCRLANRLSVQGRDQGEAHGSPGTRSQRNPDFTSYHPPHLNRK